MTRPPPPHEPTLDWSAPTDDGWRCPTCGRTSGRSGACPFDETALAPLDVDAPFDPDSTLVGRTLDGRYDVHELIGRGGMGAVYRATQRSVEREVAVKVIRRSRASDSAAVQRFFNEARAVSRLVHPNIVTLYDFGESEDGVLYMAMELVHGDSLATVLTRRGRLPSCDAAAIGVQVCDALIDAHAAGVVHRDLKPENIVLATRAGRAPVAKVLDFGIAKLPRSDTPFVVTQVGAFSGTPRYASPEQALGLPVDARTDLYALGVVLYELVTGAPLFEGNDAVEVLKHHANVPAPAIAARYPRLGVDPRLEQVILRCLDKQADRRFASAESLRDALRPFARATARPARGPRPAVMVVAVAGLAAVVIGGVALTGKSLVRSLGGAPAASPGVSTTVTPGRQPPASPDRALRRPIAPRRAPIVITLGAPTDLAPANDDTDRIAAAMEAQAERLATAFLGAALNGGLTSRSPPKAMPSARQTTRVGLVTTYAVDQPVDGVIAWYDAEWGKKATTRDLRPFGGSPRLTLTAVLDDAIPFMTLTVSASGPTSSEVVVSMKP